MASPMRFWVIGSPICTAVAGLPEDNASEENVAPWIPSKPTRPPRTTTKSPGRALFLDKSRPLERRGMSPTVPANTSGFPR